MPEAQTDIDNMAATDLFLKYGTHVITGFVLGGSLDYSMSADVSVMEEAVDWGIATSGGFELLSMGGSASVEFSSYEKMRNERPISSLHSGPAAGNHSMPRRIRMFRNPHTMNGLQALKIRANG